MHIRPALTLAAVAALTVPALAVPAEAETVVDADTTGDMVRVDYIEESDTFIYVPVPGRTLNDVSEATLDHRRRRVAIELDFVALKRKAGGQPQVVDVAMASNEGVRRHLQLAAWSGHWSGETQMYNGRWRTVRCSIRDSIDYDADVTRLSFPRGCASNPRWVTFRVGSYVEDEEYVIDDALRDRAMTVEDERFKRSGRVHREQAG